jgi:hypothetical protein
MAKATSSNFPNSDIANSPSSSMGQNIINYIRAGYPGLYLVSHEEQRVAVEMTRIAQELKYNLVFWSVVDGLVDVEKGTNNSANDPLEALIAVGEMKEKTLIVLRDFHLFLQDPNPILIRKFKDVLQEAKTKSKTLIILGCRMVLPPELERELTMIEFALPGKAELGAVLAGIMESAGIKTMEAETQDKVIDAASGLTTIEAENAFALSVVESKAIDPVIVAKEKAQAVKKNGLLELIETRENLDSIGGLFATFLNWMQEKKAPVFVVATANDVSQLPPEMLRKGRWDELWFVDLPNQAEREAIWEIQIGKHGRDPKDFDIVQLAKATEGLTGSEIENVFIEALYLAFDSAADGEKEPTDLDIARVLTEFVPLSKLMAEQIGALKNWAKGRARLATSLAFSERKLRKMVV